jgi:hypothetical protein
MSSDTGVQVATGDPGQLFQAAQWHLDLADGLSAHGHTIATAATSVSSSWTGEAAASYQALSGIVAAHFWNTAGISRTAAASLHRYGSELARLQLEGVQALRQAEHWLGEVNTWTARVQTANDAVTRAQGAVQTAETTLSHATAGPHGTAVPAAAAQVRTAQDDLTRAQSEQRKAQHELDDAQHQLSHWQKRGAELWHEAQAAAIRATGELQPLTVAAPPLAGAPFSGLPGPSLPPATDNPWRRWIENPPLRPNKSVTDPNPRDHRCQPGEIFLPYFGCQGHPPKLPPAPPPPSHGSPGCGGGIQIPGLGCIEPPSLPSPPSLPPLPPLPPIPLPA